MSCLGTDRHGIKAVIFVALLAAATARSQADTLLQESFTNDPVANGRAAVTAGDAGRYTYSGGALTAAYDSSQPTALLVWSLGQTLTQNTSFSYRVTYQIQNLVAPTDSGGQIAFGLINSHTTGTDRTGSYANYTSDNTYDIVTVDYFPAPSSWPGAIYPTLAPTEINSASADAGGDAFTGLNSVFGSASQLAALLPAGSPVTTTVSYDAATGDLVETTTDADNNILSNVDLALPGGTVFSVDSFAIPLWQDGFYDPTYEPALTADVAFSSISVSAPEPASLLLLLSGAGVVLLRRRTRR